jgi:aspartyl-tRNA(Asn)/glutamyl-tRNA(Gln) amidotransferase subunit B
VVTAERRVGDFFEQVVACGVEPKRALNLIEALRETPPEWMTLAQLHASAPTDRGMTPQQVAEVARLTQAGKVAANKDTAKAILMHMMDKSVSAEQAASELGLLQSTDTGAIDAAIDALLAQNPKSLQDVRAGKMAAIGSLVGMIMKGGKGLNPKLVQERLRARLGL